MAKHASLRFLVDLGVGKRVEDWLKSQGHDVACVRDLGPRIPDAEILRIAAADHRMVITMDTDFGELVYNSGLSHAGVLLLRLEDARSDEKIAAVSGILHEHSDKVPDRFCVYKDGKLRIRK